MSAPSNDYSPAFETLVAYFEANDFRLHADPDMKSVWLIIRGNTVVYNCRLQLTHNDLLIQARINYPVVVRDKKIRPLVAEAVARANQHISIGNFNIDMDTGDINFHLGQAIQGNGLNDGIIKRVFLIGLETADRYFPAIMRVMFAGHTPADAVYLSEIDVHAEAVEAGEGESPSTPNPPKRVAKRPKAPRKGSTPKTTKNLPRLTDERTDQGDGGPQRK